MTKFFRKYKTGIDYDSMPKPPKKDNKDYKVGSGGFNKNTIRFPKKVRKTAWKRFFKLFPKLRYK